jgi:shikimate 5-dehydrogenase
MLRLFGIIERMYRFARGFFDYFAGINIDNPSKRNINTLLYSIKPKSAQIHALDHIIFKSTEIDPYSCVRPYYIQIDPNRPKYMH